MLGSLWARPDFSALFAEPGAISHEAMPVEQPAKKERVKLPRSLKVVSGKKTSPEPVEVTPRFPPEWEALNPYEREELCDLVMRGKPVTYARLGARSESALLALQKAKLIEMTGHESASFHSQRVRLSGAIVCVTPLAWDLLTQVLAAAGLVNLNLLQEVLRKKARQFRSRVSSRKSAATRKLSEGQDHAAATATKPL
jgi:hypothetical protein